MRQQDAGVVATFTHPSQVDLGEQRDRGLRDRCEEILRGLENPPTLGPQMPLVVSEVQVVAGWTQEASQRPDQLARHGCPRPGAVERVAQRLPELAPLGDDPTRRGDGQPSVTKRFDSSQARATEPGHQF